MRKHLLFISFLLLGALISQAQWQPDLRLTNDPSVSQALTNRGVAASGDVVHVVWRDFREVNHSEIYYKQSTDGGVSWGADIRLTFKTQIIINGGIYQESFFPTVAVSGSVVHVVWHDERDGNYEIYYKRSVDGGKNWGADTRLSNASASSDAASIAVSGSNVYVVWEDERDRNYQIYYKLSTDGGASWGEETPLTKTYAQSENPCVSASGSDVHVVWQDNRDGNYEMYYKRSTDGGLGWASDTRLTTGSSYSYLPSVSVSGSTVNVVWEDIRDGRYENIYHKRSTDAGLSWDKDTLLTSPTADAHHASVSVSGALAYVVWFDNRDGNYEIYYKRSTDGGANWGADTRLTNIGGSQYPAVALSGKAVHVIWQKQDEIYYKRNPTGDLTGLKELPSSDIQFTVFPNPAITEIKVHSLENINEITITDLYGEKIYHSEGLNSTRKVLIPVSDLPAGVYFIRLKNGKKISVQKFIKL